MRDECEHLQPVATSLAAPIAVGVAASIALPAVSVPAAAPVAVLAVVTVPAQSSITVPIIAVPAVADTHTVPGAAPFAAPAPAVACPSLPQSLHPLLAALCGYRYAAAPIDVDEVCCVSGLLYKKRAAC